MNTNAKVLSRSVLMILVTLLGSVVLGANVNSAHSYIGMVKAYGPAIGSPQPYEPVGPFMDGVLVPQFLVNQVNEWTALKTGAVDVNDWAMLPAQVAEYNSNICVAAPDAPAGIAPCGANQAPIQHEITITNVAALDKFEIDFQNAKFPTNVLAFRQAVAWVTDKENFTTNFLGGLGVPLYSTMPCPTLCDPVSGQWVDPSLETPTAQANHVYGSGLPVSTRIATANAIMDAAGFTVGTQGTGFPGGPYRENHRPGCATDPGGCGAVIQPLFRIRIDDVNRLALGRFVHSILQNSVHVDMDIGGASKYTGDVANYLEQTRRVLFNEVFFLFSFNMYTGGWGLGRDPTILNDLYNSAFISPGNTNYDNYRDPVFDQAGNALRAATSLTNAVSAAHAAEIEYNATLPAIDLWANNAPYAYRNYHVDSDSALNGLQWAGFQFQQGVGYHNSFTWMNAQLIGAPLHDPAHPLFLKWGWRTDVLDAPNPIDSSFQWDLYFYSLPFDTVNNLATDDLKFSGDFPWMASLPVQTNIASGALFPDGSTCVPDAPATGCSVLSYQLRPDLYFAASLDGSVPAIPVTPDDVAFSILVGRDSPTAFVSSAYVHVQNVLTNTKNPTVVTDPSRFLVEERNQAVWDRHDIGATVVISVQHWCVEPHNLPSGGVNYWPGESQANCISGSWPVPAGAGAGNVFGTQAFPEVGVNAASSIGGMGVNQAYTPGPKAAAVDLGSGPFVFDSLGSFSAPNGPALFRLRQTPGELLQSPYTASAPDDGYFTTGQGSTTTLTDPPFSFLPPGPSPAIVSGATICKVATDAAVTTATFTCNVDCPGVCTPLTWTSPIPGSGAGSSVSLANGQKYLGASTGAIVAGNYQGHYIIGARNGGWHKFHHAGNINWLCTACTAGPSEIGPIPSPDHVINIVDLAIVAAHFGQTPGVMGFPFGHAAYDLSGPVGIPDGKVDILDLTRVALHFGQSYLGGTDIGGGAAGSVPGWLREDIAGT